MKAILVCPSERHGVAFLSTTSPLVCVPILGDTVVAYWLAHLAARQFTDVELLVTDRPEYVQGIVNDGSRWGLRVKVTPILREPSPAEVLAGSTGATGAAEAQIIEHLPGMPERPLFTSYSAWFDATLAWLPHAALLPRIGIREISSGIWVGLRSQISPRAQLIPPCWIGESVWVGPDSVIGPNAVLEHRVVVESAAEVSNSIIGPETFVGGLTQVRSSLAWGSTLINWRNNSCTIVPDAFLLSPLSQRQFQRRYHLVTRSITDTLIATLTKPFEMLSPDRR